MVLALLPATQLSAQAAEANELIKLNQGNVSQYYTVGDGLLELKGGNYQLEEDLELENPLYIAGDVTLDLNGCVLKLNGSFDGNGLITISAWGSLTLKDSDSSKEHYFKKNANGVWEKQPTKTADSTVVKGGCIFGCGDTKYGVVMVSNRFTMEGGCIFGFKGTDSKGGGVYVDNDATFTMTGGSIVGCEATNGGGVYVEGGTFTMTGGNISDCKATNGGGVYVGGYEDEISGIFTKGTFAMNGGYIKDCTATTSDGVGGVRANTQGILTNTSDTSATVCYGELANQGKLENSCLVTFKDGTTTYAYEVVKKDGKAVKPETAAGYGWKKPDGNFFDFSVDTVSGALTLTKGERSYTVKFVTKGGNPVNDKTVKWNDQVLDGVNAIRPGYSIVRWLHGDTPVKADTKYSELAHYDSVLSITLTAYWTEKSNYTVEFTSDGSTVQTRTGVKWTDKVLADIGNPTKAGYTFKGWKHVKTIGNTTVETAVGADTKYSALVDNDTVLTIELTAVWEENSNYTVVFDSNGGTAVDTKTGVNWTDKVLDGVENPRRVDWEFKGWTLNGQSVTADHTYGDLIKLINENDQKMSITLTAEWLYAPACSFIEATAGEGGSISPAGFSVVLDGNDKTFTITPDSGYLVADVLVDGESVGAVSTYTFTDVRVDHTIEAEFVLVQFDDCTEDDWYYPDVTYVAANGIMRGTGSGDFSPDVSTTHGMLVTMLYRLDGEPKVSGSCAFADVEAGSYCEAAVIWANANGIVKGYDNGLFGANDAITREQLAVILYRYAEFKGLDVSVGEDTDISSYSDASETADYALPAMKWVCGVGILHGNGNNQLMPKGSATRAEVAAILHRFCENILK